MGTEGGRAEGREGTRGGEGCDQQHLEAVAQYLANLRVGVVEQQQ